MTDYEKTKKLLDELQIGYKEDIFNNDNMEKIKVLFIESGKSNRVGGIGGLHCWFEFNLNETFNELVLEE